MYLSIQSAMSSRAKHLCSSSPARLVHPESDERKGSAEVGRYRSLLRFSAPEVEKGEHTVASSNLDDTHVLTALVCIVCTATDDHVTCPVYTNTAAATTISIDIDAAPVYRSHPIDTIIRVQLSCRRHSTQHVLTIATSVQSSCHGEDAKH